MRYDNQLVDRRQPTWPAAPAGVKSRTKIPSSRKRGQQPGTKGHGRTPVRTLKTTEEHHVPPADEFTCLQCNAPYGANGAHQSEIFETFVQTPRSIGSVYRVQAGPMWERPRGGGGMTGARRMTNRKRTYGCSRYAKTGKDCSIEPIDRTITPWPNGYVKPL